MVNNRFNKKGQAAIEFLMTYGWMLLVVLIVGALVFSFVDFGSLLPNKVDVSTQSIKGDSANSAAYASDYAEPTDANMIYVGFVFTGGQKGTISPEHASIVTDLGKICWAMSVTNERLNTNLTVTRNVATGAVIGTPGSAPEFLSGQPGMIKFQCNATGTAVEGLGNLLAKDVIEGQVSIGVKDVKRGTGARSIPNTGAFRLSIQ